MSKWCLNHKVDLPDFKFYPNAPNKALCKDCVKARRKDRNKDVTLEADRRKRDQDAIKHIIRDLQKSGESYVYLIEHDNHYKIGTSRNIGKRLRSFNTSHAIPCKIIAIAPGDTTAEKLLHNKFEVFRITGEWFVKKPAILNGFSLLPDVIVFLPGYLIQEA